VTSTLNGVPCIRETAPVKVTMINFVPGSIASDQTICEGSIPGPLTSVTPTGDGSFTYRWFSSPDNSTYTVIPSAVNETFNPLALSADTWYKREVTSTLSGKACVLETNFVRVTVNNFMPGMITGDQTICEGSVPAGFASVAPTGDGTVYNYQWKSSTDGVNFINIAGATSDVYSPAALFQDTWYKRIVTSVLNGVPCVKETNVIKVTVNNVNAGTIISDQTICNGSDPVSFMSIVNGTGDGVITYQWQNSIDNFTFIDIPGADAPVYDPPVIAVDTWYRRITKSVLNTVECSRLSNVLKITVNKVLGGTIAANQTICSGITPAVITSSDDGSGTGSVTYQWLRSSDNIIFSTIPGATSTDYAPAPLVSDTWFKRTIISIQNGILCTSESNVVKITINPLPIAMLSGGETICPGQTSRLRVEMMAGTGPFELNIENHGTVTGYVSGGDIIVSPVATTSYKLLSVRDDNGCQIISPNAGLIGTATVTVRALPVITASPVSKTICEFNSASFSATASGSDISWQWYVDKGSGFTAIAEGGVYVGTTSASMSIFGADRSMNGYIYQAVATGCSASVTSGNATLTVNTPPMIEVQPVESAVCAGGASTFSVTASGTAITYQWQVKSGAAPFVNILGAPYSGETTSTLTISGTPISFNNNIYRVIVNGTCPSPAYSGYVILKVKTLPVVTMNPESKSVCDAAGTVYFRANGSGTIDSLRWQVNDGGTWSDIHDNEVYSGTNSQQLSFMNPPLSLNGKQYRLALKAACTTVYTNQAILTVNGNPVVTFASDTVNACGGIAKILIPTVSGGSGVITQRVWSGDIGLLNSYNDPSPSFKTSIPGTYSLVFRVKDHNGCYGSGAETVNVDSPDATFVKDKTADCTPFTVNFTKDMTGIASYSWNFGDGSAVNTTVPSPSHEFTNTTPTTVLYRTVTLSVLSTGGCPDTKTSTVTVYPSVDATFSGNKTTICSGESITFSAIPGAGTYSWDYGDGSGGPGTNASTHMYINTGSSDLNLVVSLTTTSFYGCNSTRTLNITVKPKPAPEFSPRTFRQNYSDAGNVVDFNNETNAGTWTWSWSFGDGGTSTVINPSHTYTTIGTFDVILEVSNGTCSQKVTHQVIIDPKKPVASFDNIPSGCEPLLMTITNTSQNINVAGTRFMWDFGDGGTSSAKNPAYTFYVPGSYNVRLIVSGPGGDSEYSQTVHVYETPVAIFDLAPAYVFVNDEKVRAFNHTSKADYFVWEWGDGDTSMTRDPFHKYMESGVYDVSLSAYKDNGNGNICYSKYIMSPGVTVEPAGEIRFASVFRPNAAGAIEGQIPTGGDAVDQFFYPPIRDKVEDYKLQIFNRLGVLIFESHDLNTPWNGYYKGQLCPQGVYVWFVEGKYKNGQVYKKVGDITLLH
jgi:PKD repeat protein